MHGEGPGTPYERCEEGRRACRVWFSFSQRFFFFHFRAETRLSPSWDEREGPDGRGVVATLQPGASPPWFGMDSCLPWPKGRSLDCSQASSLSLTPSRLCPGMLSPSVSPAPAVLGLGIPIVGAHPCLHPMAQPRLCHNSVQGEFSQKPRLKFSQTKTLQNGFNCPPQFCPSLEMGSASSDGSTGPPAATSVPGDTREGPWSWEHFGNSQDVWLSLSVLQPWWDKQTQEGGTHRQLRVWGTQQITTIIFQLLPACFWKGADFGWL